MYIYVYTHVCIYSGLRPDWRSQHAAFQYIYIHICIYIYIYMERNPKTEIGGDSSKLVIYNTHNFEFSSEQLAILRRDVGVNIAQSKVFPLRHNLFLVGP